MEILVESLPLHRFDARPEELVGAEGPSAPRGGGVLPLSTALGYATGVAAGLRDRHAEMRASAKAGPDRVQVAAQSAERLSLEQSVQRTEEHADIVAFGALLYELMAGSKPPRDLSKVLAAQVPLIGPEGVRAAATRLALQCLGADGGPPDTMRQVLTEVRLHSLMARQSAQQPPAALGYPADSPPPLSRPGSPATDVGLAALERKPDAIDPSEAQPHQSTDAPMPPRFKPALDPQWFMAPLDLEESSPLCDIKCPLCRGGFVYPSRPRTGFEKLLIASGIHLNRCHRCFYRYVTILGIVLPKKAPFF